MFAPAHGEVFVCRERQFVVEQFKDGFAGSHEDGEGVVDLSRVDPRGDEGSEGGHFRRGQLGMKFVVSFFPLFLFPLIVVSASSSSSPYSPPRQCAA